MVGCVQLWVNDKMAGTVVVRVLFGPLRLRRWRHGLPGLHLVGILYPRRWPCSFPSPTRRSRPSRTSAIPPSPVPAPALPSRAPAAGTPRWGFRGTARTGPRKSWGVRHGEHSYPHPKSIYNLNPASKGALIEALTDLLEELPVGVKTMGVMILFGALGIYPLASSALRQLQRVWPPQSFPGRLQATLLLLPYLALVIWVFLAAIYEGFAVVQDLQSFIGAAQGQDEVPN